MARGASLIEVLVALLVMTLGLLGMISLHTAAVRYHKMAEFRSVATQLAEDYGDRMRANITGARNGNYVYNQAWKETPTKVTDPGISCSDTAPCTPTDMAQQVAASDIAQWLNNAIGLLPGVGLYAVRPTGAGAQTMIMDVWITWLDPSANTTQSDTNKMLEEAYVCPAGIGTVKPEVRCLRYRFTL